MDFILFITLPRESSLNFLLNFNLFHFGYKPRKIINNPLIMITKNITGNKRLNFLIIALMHSE